MRYHYNCTCGYASTYETDRTAPETINCNRCNSSVQRKGEKVVKKEEPVEQAQPAPKRRGRPKGKR